MIKFFTPRVATAERREQIVEATLRLLARTPIESLTTRQLATELGLSQPALFRHFESREALVLAVVAYARADLEKIASGIVAGGARAVVQLRALGQALLEHVEKQPGLPRLLFASATPAAGPVRDALRHVVAMQAALLAELVRQGQREGDVRVACEPDHAATLFIGMVQGLVLRWEITARRGPLAASFDPLFELWLHGVAPATPGSSTGPREAIPVKQDGPHEGGVALHLPRHGAGSPLAALDVRPLIARGVDPLATILATLEGLPPAGVLVIDAPFRPAPLLALLTRRGHAVTAEALDGDQWRVDVVLGGKPAIEDLRELEPPEPLERVLTASASLAPGDVYLARLPRFPRMLVPHLHERGLAFDILESADGSALLRVVKKP